MLLTDQEGGPVRWRWLTGGDRRCQTVATAVTATMWHAQVATTSRKTTGQKNRVAGKDAREIPVGKRNWQPTQSPEILLVVGACFSGVGPLTRAQTRLHDLLSSCFCLLDVALSRTSWKTRRKCEKNGVKMENRRDCRWSSSVRRPLRCN